MVSCHGSVACKGFALFFVYSRSRGFFRNGHRLHSGRICGGERLRLRSEQFDKRCVVQARGRKVNLRVSSISPGVVETEFLTVHGFGDEDAAKERYPVTSHMKSSLSSLTTRQLQYQPLCVCKVS